MMLIRPLSLFAAIAAAAMPVLAMAQTSLSELRARQVEEQSLSSEAAYTAKVCKANIATRIDWDRASNWPDDESIADACDGALGAIEAICREDAGRVSGRISTFTCAGDGSGPSLNGSVLTFGATPGGNGFDETRDYLDGAL